jgi:hypothetical protein
MSVPKLIGLSGKAGSGKDFIGKNVLRPLGYARFSLAWHMKNEAVGGIVKPHYEDMSVLLKPTWEECHITKPPHIREWLQQRGTENGWQQFGKDYWLRIADAWMRCLREDCGLAAFYVPDVRFPHEVEWIQAQGGKVFRIVGRGGLEGEAGKHSSETALDDYTDFDGYLFNGYDTQLDAIRKCAMRLIYEL